MKTDADLIEAGKAAALEGLRLFHLDVRDPSVADIASRKTEALRCQAVIDDMLRLTRWHGYTPYKGNGKGPEWCGVTADACWIAAGLDPMNDASWFGSTVRLFAWAHGKRNPVTGKPTTLAPGAVRRIAKLGPNSTVADLTFKPREGDIVVIGRVTDNKKLRVVGRHIEVTTGVDMERGVIFTVGGNAGGNGPDGKPREGITVAERHIGPGGARGDHVMWVYRPAPSDLL